MSLRKVYISSLLIFTSILVQISGINVLARGNDITIKSGMGEEFTIKNGLFSSKSKVVKDRYGNKFEQKKGLFGGKKTEVNVLGNSFSAKKGLFGSTNVEGNTIFGDTVKTKKGLFGNRKTEVDLSGVSTLVNNLMQNKKPQTNLPNNANESFPSELPESLPTSDQLPK
jgi:hypothetical protein